MAETRTQHQSLILVQDYGVNGSSCGYCGNRHDSSVSHGMSASQLPVELYQALLDRGWRRSGKWLYRPVLEQTCCQLITIRLDVNKFEPNKEQKKVQRKWESYLAGAPLRTQPPATNEPQQQMETAVLGVQIPARTPNAAAPTDVDGQLMQSGSPKRSRPETAWMSSSPDQRRDGKRFRGSYEALEKLVQASPAANKNDIPLFAPSLPRPVSVSDILTTIHIDTSAINDERNNEAHKLPGETFNVKTGIIKQDKFTTTEEKCAAVKIALQQALEATKESGELPALDYPALKVAPATEAQKKKVGDKLVLCTAAALAVAGVANKHLKQQQQGSSVTADRVAALLIEHLKLPAPLSLVAESLNGHINFTRTSPLAQDVEMAQPTPTRRMNGQHTNSKAKKKEVTQLSPKSPLSSVKQPTNAQHQGIKSYSEAVAPPHAIEVAVVPRSVPRHFEFRTVPSNDPSLVDIEFELYQKYQVVHHGDDPSDATRRGFRRFLCDSPLRNAPASDYPPGSAPPGGFGSFHQQYFLDGRLIAVGVVDVLPKCLSSKYLFWDPDLAPLSLGKLSSLKEIDWVKNASANCPSLHYYYMGFYLHTCHRMKYKADFAPSDLLCPVNKCWVPINKVKQALGSPGIVNLAAVESALNGLDLEYGVENGQPVDPPSEPSDAVVNSVKLYLPLPGRDGAPSKGQIVTYQRLLVLGIITPVYMQHLKGRLKEWILAVGEQNSKQMLYQL